MASSEKISSENQEAEEFFTHYILENIFIRAMMVFLIITLRRIIITSLGSTDTYG